MNRERPKPFPILQAALAGFVVLAVAYAVSAPFRSKIDRSVEQATSWTPKNIQADPVGYLHDAKRKIQTALDTIDAAKIELAQKKASTTTLLIEQVAERDAVATVLTELKQAYKQSRDTDSWPAAVAGQMISEPTLRNRIVEAHARLEDLSEQTALVESAVQRLDQRESVLAYEENNLKRTIRKIDADLEVVRTTDTLEAIDAITVDLASIEAVSSSLAAQPQAGSLESMIAQRRAESGRASFEEILDAD
tara:strand:- start:5660 stop:6409 length:750 start_codon:yes stop_codon:yes gene_type:complete